MNRIERYKKTRAYLKLAFRTLREGGNGCDLGQSGIDLSGMEYSANDFLEGKKDQWENEL